MVSSAQPAPRAGTLTIAGTGFGRNPFVTLDLVRLAVRSATDSEIVATAPISLMPPGDYVLTVSLGPGPGEHASLDVPLHGGAAAGGSTPATRSGSGTRPAAAVRTNGTDGPRLAAEPGTVAATVGNRVITVAEVDREWRRQDPGGFVALAREIHDTRWRFTDTLVAEALIAHEADTQGLTPEALLEREIPPRIVEMPESAVRSLYADVGTAARGASYEQMEPALRAWLERVTARELARMNYLEELTAVSINAELALDAPRVAVERTAQDARLGPETAPVELVVFGDFQSADYARFAAAFTRVRETYGGRVRLVFKHLPPPDRPAAIQAAQAAQCANLQEHSGRSMMRYSHVRPSWTPSACGRRRARRAWTRPGSTPVWRTAQRDGRFWMRWRKRCATACTSARASSSTAGSRRSRRRFYRRSSSSRV